MARDNVLRVRILADDETRRGFQQATAGLAAFSAAATAALGAATKQAADFEKGMAEIQTLLGSQATPAIAEMRKELLAASRASGETLGALTKARYDIISAGFSDAAESATLLQASMDVARGGLVEVSEAADLLTTAVNGMGLGADEATRAADVLFTTVRLGKTTMGELAESLGQVFSTARVARVSMEEVGAAMATVTAAGIDTREASTALNNLLRALAAPSKEAGRELANLGITLENGLGPALEALGKAGEQGLDQLAKLIPNIRALKAAASAGSDIETFNANLLQMRDAAGAASDAAAIMEDTLTHQAKLLRAELGALAVEIGDALVPVVREMAQTARGAAAAFSELSPEMKTAIAISTAAAAAVTGLAAAVGGLTLALNAALPSLVAVGAAMAPLAPWLAAGAAAAAGLGVAISRVRSELDRMPNFDAKDVIGGATPTLNVRPGQSQAAAQEQEQVAAATNAVSEAFAILSQRTQEADFKLAEFLGEAPGDFELLIGALREAGAEAETVDRVFAAWEDSVGEAVPKIRTEIEQLNDAIDDTGIGDGLLGDMPDVALPRAPEEINHFATAMKESFLDVQAAAQDLLHGTFRAFGDAFAAAVVEGEDFGEAFTELFSNLKQQIISVIAEMLVMRTVMAGLKAVAGFGGPLGAVAGFLLPGENDGTSFMPKNAALGFQTVPGTPGLDATPALLSGGEGVLTERQNRMFRSALGMPGRGRESLLSRMRDQGGGQPLVVGLSSGLLRTEAADIDDRLARVERRRGGR